MARRHRCDKFGVNHRHHTRARRLHYHRHDAHFDTEGCSWPTQHFTESTLYICIAWCQTIKDDQSTPF